MSPRQKVRGRNAQLDRVLQIIQDLLRLDGCDLYELGERYGAAVKTIRRDLEAIQLAGLALEQEPAPDGKRLKWKLKGRDAALARAAEGLDASHYLALQVVMADAGAVARESGLYAALEDLLRRIEAAVGEKGRRRLQAVEGAFLPWDKHAYTGAAREAVWPLVEAIAGRRVCRVGYRAVSTGGARRTYEVLPLKVFVHDRALYVLCQFQGRGTIGTLNLHRLEQVEVTDRTAEPPAGFDAAAYAESAFGIYPGARPVTYVLRFRPEVAAYIKERSWHPSQALEDLSDGGVQLTFRCGESYEVTSWVAGWREWVTVQRPASLRRDLAALGERWKMKYGAAGSA